MPPRLTSVENVTSYGFSGEKENSLRADRPLASRNSSVSVAGAAFTSSDAALGLNSACASAAFTPASSVISVKGFVDPGGAVAGTSSSGAPFSA